MLGSMSLAAEPLQTDLFAAGVPALAPARAVERTWLDDACWIDVVRGFVAGADALFVALRDGLAWRQASRRMYERIVDVPRLTADLRSLADLGPAGSWPALVTEIGDRLGDRYEVPLRIDLAAYYRDGRDSVAWHADRVDPTRREHTSAIVSLGGPRKLALRRKGGGSSRTVTLWSGDLLVFGGALQHRFEHCVPKVGYAAPRISLLAFGAFADEPSSELHRLVTSTDAAGESSRESSVEVGSALAELSVASPRATFART